MKNNQYHEEKPNLGALFDAVRSLPPLIPKKDRYRQSIEKVGVGGVIKFDGKTWRVESVSRYDECQEGTWKPIKGEHTFELQLLNLMSGETGWIEWSKDDAVEMYLTTRSVQFRDLRDDGNEMLDKTDLPQIIDDEDSVFYGGKEFEYGDNWPALYHRDCGDTADRVSFYEFYADDGTCLTIEQWEGDEFQVFLSRELRVREIEILALKGQ